MSQLKRAAPLHRQDPLTVLAFCSLPPHSLSNNVLTNHGKDMSGVLQLLESLKVNNSLTSLSYMQPA